MHYILYIKLSIGYTCGYLCNSVVGTAC